MPLDTNKNAFWANPEIRSANNGWDGTALSFLTDEFQFYDTGRGATDSATPISDALHAALDSRDIAVTDIEDFGAFKSATPLLQAVFESDIETSADVQGLFGDEFNVTFVDDLATTNGVALNGAAILGSDEIVIDSALTGEDLRDTLIEEIAETAYQQAYDTTSIGDFGAEVLAILNGEEDKDVLAAFSKETASDTVETDYGTAEADTRSQVVALGELIEADNSSVSVVRSTAVSDTSYETFYPKILEAAAAAGENKYGETFFGELPSDVLATLAETKGTLDFDGDGNETTSVSFALDNYGVTDDTKFSTLDTGLVEIVDWSDDATVVPLSGGLASGTLVGTGGTADARKVVSVSEGETYSTSEEFNWSTTTTAKGEIFGLGLEVSGTVGESVTETNEFTATTSVSDWYTVYQSDYEEGEVISYGQHAFFRDATIANQYAVWFELNDADGVEGHAVITFEDKNVVEDYLYTIAMYDTTVDELGTITPASTLGLDDIA